MKIIILGASGFIGKNLLLHIHKQYDVTSVYFNSNNFLDFIQKNNIITTAIKCDLSDFDSTKHIFLNTKYDVVISLFANKNPSQSGNDPLYDFRNNALPIYNVLSNISAQKVIYFSSGLVYEDHRGEICSRTTVINPTIPYAISKFYAEQLVKLAKKNGNINDYVIVRFWGAYGPYQSTQKIYSKLVKNFGIDKNENFIIKGDGHSLIDAMYVEDVVSTILNIILNRSPGDITFDFCGGNPTTILQLVMTAAKLFSIEPTIKFQGDSYETIDFYSKDTLSNLFSKSKTSLDDGLMKLYNWQKNNPGEL